MAARRVTDKPARDLGGAHRTSTRFGAMVARVVATAGIGGHTPNRHSPRLPGAGAQSAHDQQRDTPSGKDLP